MNTASFVICLSLVGQSPAADPGTAPATRFEPRRTAPPTRLDDRSPAPPRTTYRDEAPLDTRSRSSFDSDPRSQTSLDNDGLSAVERNMVQRLRPPEIMAEALSIVPEGAFAPVDGEPDRYAPVRLVDALRRGRDRAHQIRIAQAYWSLAIALADYHYSRDAVARLRDATRGQVSQPALRAARCAMRALQRDSEALVIRAQSVLADEMQLSPTSQIPLAVDVPHTGSYDTRFSQVFANRPAPSRLYLIDRMLPVRRQAIEEHGEGIVASLDALDTSIEEYNAGTADLTTLLVAFERLWKERKAFTAAVRSYNREIAEYALTVANPASDASELVAMLIKTSPDTGATPPPTAAPGTSTTPPRNNGRYSEPIDDEAPPASRIRNEAAPPPFGGRQTSFEQTSVDRDSFVQLTSAQTPGPLLHTANLQTEIRRNIDFDDTDAQRSLWRALVHVDTPLRTQRLSNNLHAPESLPKDFGRPASLAECLSMCQPSQRRDVISAYWAAREAAAVYTVLNDELTELTSLSQLAVRIRNAPGGPEAVIRLQGMITTVKAALIDAEAELMNCQYDLTTLCGGRADQPWLLPDTAPHGGRYLLRIEEQPRELVEAQGLEMRGSLIKVLHHQMVDHAGTVVYADLARATALRNPAAGPKAFDLAMALVERQATHTIFFLRATTKYNVAIADYVLAIMPVNIPADKLVSALVLTRSTSTGS